MRAKQLELELPGGSSLSELVELKFHSDKARDDEIAAHYAAWSGLPVEEARMIARGGFESYQGQ